MAALTFTRRGRVVLAVVVLSLAMSIAAGGRALDAVILSGCVALVAGYLQLRSLDPPRFERRLPGDDHAGQEGSVALVPHDGDRVGQSGRSASSPSRPFVATVADRLGEGLVAPDEPVRTTVGEEPVRYRVRYEARGDHSVGPTDVTATDVFGLFTKEFTVGGTDSVLVYPARHPVAGWVDVGGHGEGALEAGGREEFDRLREYARGDALRDVHWAATAKHGGLVVREYAAETGQDRVRLVGGTAPDAGPAAADRLAEAAVSLALPISEAGVPLDCRLPNGTVDAEATPTDRRRLRELAARVASGPVPDDDAATVRLVADDDRVVVETPAGTTTFDALRADDPDDPGDPGDRDEVTERSTPTGSGRRNGDRSGDGSSESSTVESSTPATDGGVFR